MKTTTITYLDVELICTGNFEEETRGIKYDEDLSGTPDYPATFEIKKVETTNGDDITGLFYAGQIEYLESLCLNNLL